MNINKCCCFVVMNITATLTENYKKQESLCFFTNIKQLESVS